VFDAAGKIVDFGPWDIAQRYSAGRLLDLSGKLILPGFVDSHVHLPQYVFAGLGAHELLPWLETFTFPIEARFADDSFAQVAVDRFFSDLVAEGTTFASVYATSHTRATEIAFAAAEAKGLRAVIGKILMERNAPAEICGDWREALVDSERLAERWHGRDGRLFYAVTPRFAITCGEESMRAAGELARRRDLFVQTHLSENRDEITFVKSLFPKCKSYTDVYHTCGLLGPRTLLGHCIHLDGAEIRTLLESGAVAVHCPTSNRHLQSGFFPLRRYQDLGLRMALGSDVAGGYCLSMLHEMREAIETTKSWNIANHAEKLPPLSVAEALYQATLGGAEALGAADVVGSFAVGKEADFVVVDDDLLNRFQDTGLFQTPLDRLARVVYRSSTREIAATYVRGKAVFERT
jgi:guanine deaminase